jgi:putative hydrolase of HD superfamily
MVDIIQQIKTIPRTNWSLRGINYPESVAAHSWGVVAWAAHIAMEENVGGSQLAQVLLHATFHDIGEAWTGDLIRSQKAMLGKHADPLELQGYWEAMQNIHQDIREILSTEDGLVIDIVMDADVIDLVTTAIFYDKERGHRLHPLIYDVLGTMMQTKSGAKLLGDFARAYDGMAVFGELENEEL